MAKVILDTDFDRGLCTYCGSPISLAEDLVVIGPSPSELGLQPFHARCVPHYLMAERRRAGRRLERLSRNGGRP